MLLKECAEVLAEPLSMIFQQSFQSGCLPADWKSANVVPIFKKGKRGDVSNYRPVSLTSVPCKVLESLLKEDLTEHLESTSMLGNETRVPENPGNPPIFKPINPDLCALKNPGLTGLVLGVSTTRCAWNSVQKFIFGGLWEPNFKC